MGVFKRGQSPLFTLKGGGWVKIKTLKWTGSCL